MELIVCPYCFEKIWFANKCSKCGETLSSNLRGGNLMFSVVGAKTTGKSCYIATLINELEEQAGKYGFTMTTNDETMDLYERRFKRPLYEYRETIGGTQTHDRDASRPLIYTLDFLQCEPRKRANLIFYDAPGERFNREEDMRKYTRYLSNSAGIIFLVDPFQLPAIREYYLKRRGDESGEISFSRKPTSEALVGKVFNRLINVMESEGKRDSTTGKFSVPLAVALTKIDALRSLLTDEAPVFLPPRHSSGVSEGDVRRNHDYFRNFLTVEPTFFNNIRLFQRVACFGVSALGQIPQENEKLRFEPRPIRALDPILWLLWTYGLIEKK